MDMTGEVFHNGVDVATSCDRKSAKQHLVSLHNDVTDVTAVHRHALAWGKEHGVWERRGQDSRTEEDAAPESASADALFGPDVQKRPLS